MGGASALQRRSPVRARPARRDAGRGRARTRAPGGTRLVYEVWATPRNLLGRLGDPRADRLAEQAPLRVGLSPLRRARGGTRSDRGGAERDPSSRPAGAVVSRPHATRLAAAGVQADLVERLARLVERGDDLSVAGSGPTPSPTPGEPSVEPCSKPVCTPRGQGCSSFSGICSARFAGGPRRARRRSTQVDSQVHCETCNIDFQVDFDRVGGAHASARTAADPSGRAVDYCVGGPRVTPHIVRPAAPAAGRAPFARASARAPGSYRLRTLDGAVRGAIVLAQNGRDDAAAKLTALGWAGGELRVAPGAALELENATARRAALRARAAGLARAARDGGRGDRPPALPRPLLERGAPPRRADRGRHPHGRLHRPARLDAVLSRGWRRARVRLGHGPPRRAAPGESRTRTERS